MSIPSTYGGYSFADLYAKSNRTARFIFTVPPVQGTEVNVNAYAALRLNVTDSQANVALSLTTNANGIEIINTNNVRINATATQMNIAAGYYAFSFEGLSSFGWEPVTAGRFRIDLAG